MLTKRDLIDEFQDIVKQEIKNHNDSILATNVSINRLEKMIYDLISEVDARFIKLKNDENNRSKETTEKSKEITDCIGIVQRKVSEVKPILNSFSEMVTNDILKKLDKEEFWKEIEHLKLLFDKKIEFIGGQLEKERSLSVEESKVIRRQIDNTACYLYDFSNKVDSQLKEIKESFEKKIELMRVEKEGFLREISVLKKQNFVFEKTIEDLYSQINKGI
jgi:hypothetical protein